MIGFLPAWRATMDQHACPAVSASGPDGVGSVLKGSPTVFINGMMACRMGDIVVEKPGLALGPMDPIAMGCPTVIIGDVGMGAAGSPCAAQMCSAKGMGAAYTSADCSQSLGDDTPGPKKLDWVKIKLVDSETGKDLAPEELHGNTTDGAQHQMEISAGQMFSQIPPGSCTFSFPKFYDDMLNWEPPADRGSE